MMVLSYFFSMDTKEAAVNSLFVILVSQIFNLMQTILSGNVPKLDAVFFVLMIAGGILGGKAGNRIYKKIRTEYINDLFQGLMIIIMLICMYNMYRFY